MRVDFTNFGLEPPDKGKASRPGQTSTASAPAANDNATVSTGADRARFTFDQTRVQALDVHALRAPEVRQAKVEPLQQAVANGSYTVDSGKVAEAMLAEAANGRTR